MELLLPSKSSFCRGCMSYAARTGLLTLITKKMANWPPDNYVSQHNSFDRVQTLVDGGLVVSEVKFIFGFMALKSAGINFLLPKGAAW